MIIAFYIPEELADAYRKERFQPTLARLNSYVFLQEANNEHKD